MQGKNNGVIVKRDVYVTLPDNEKLIVLYDTIMSIKEDLHSQCRRLRTLEKRKLKDTTYAFGGGFLGGFVAMITRWLTGGQ